MRKLAETHDQQPSGPPASRSATEPETYADEPLASLYARRTHDPVGSDSFVYHAYPRLSGAASAYCVFDDGSLRVDVFGMTYVLRDAAAQRELTFGFPEWMAETIKTDTIGDGSFPCEVWKLRDETTPYLVFWLYPHEPRVHVWAVHANGVRRHGFDLPRASVVRFLSYRAGRNVMFAYRVLLLVQADRGGGTDIGSDASDSELLARVGEQVVNLDPLAACNVDEWGEHVAFLWNLQRLGLSDARTEGMLDGVVRRLRETKQPTVHLPGILARKRHEALARVQNWDPDVTPDDQIRAIVDGLNRGLSGAELLLPGATRQIPGARLQNLLRDEQDISARIMTQAEQEAAAKRGGGLVLFGVSLRPRLTIDVAFPGHFASYADLSESVKVLGFTQAVARLYLVILTVTDMILASSIRFGSALRRELGRLPDRLQFYLAGGDATPLDSVVAMGRKKGANNPLIPDTYFYSADAFARWKELSTADARPWHERKPVAIWRGSTSGPRIVPERIRDNPRINLAYYCNEYPDLFDVRITDVTQLDAATAARVEETLRQAGLMGGRMVPSDFRNYMFSIDIDGNANAWGFFEKLALGLCVLKVDSSWEQWFYPDLKPWVHYVPVDASLNDLVPKMEELRAKPDLAFAIAENAAAFAIERDIQSEAIAFCRELSRGVATGAVSISS